MPGLHLICDPEGGLAGKRASITRALDALRHDDRYRTTTLVDTPSCFLAHTGYDGYPIRTFRTSGVDVFLEGRLYGVEPLVLERRLRELAMLAFGDEAGTGDRVGDWLSRSDGDFVVVLVQRATSAVRIVNDALARLPLYFHSSPLHGLIVSRELRFVASLMDDLEFDRMAIANFLHSGYLLSQRTWLRNVDRVAPATLVRADPTTRQMTRRQLLPELDLEAKPHADRDVRDNAAQLAERFLAATEARYRPDAEHVLSLSGGFDSRAIGAAMRRLNLPFRCTTFVDHVGNATADVPVAERVAHALDAEWKLERLGPPSRSDALHLLRMKNGLNPLGMSFLLPFLESTLRDSCAEVCFMSGETGNFMLPDPRPARAFTEVRELTEFLGRQHQKFSPADVSELTGIDQAEILADLETHLASYPESDLRQKGAHFLLCERAMKWHSEAEDRNRCYFWHVTPFSSLEFFEFTIGCPDDQKYSYNLYREFLVHLLPSVAAIEHSGFGMPIVSERFGTAARVAALAAANPEWRDRLGARAGAAPGYGADSLVVRGLSQQLEQCDALGEYISISAATTTLERSGRHTTEQLDHLFTVTSIVEDLATGTSVLERG